MTTPRSVLTGPDLQTAVEIEDGLARLLCGSILRVNIRHYSTDVVELRASPYGRTMKRLVDWLYWPLMACNAFCVLVVVIVFVGDPHFTSRNVKNLTALVALLGFTIRLTRSRHSSLEEKKEKSPNDVGLSQHVHIGTLTESPQSNWVRRSMQADAMPAAERAATLFVVYLGLNILGDFRLNDTGEPWHWYEDVISCTLMIAIGLMSNWRNWARVPIGVALMFNSDLFSMIFNRTDAFNTADVAGNIIIYFVFVASLPSLDPPQRLRRWCRSRVWAWPIYYICSVVWLTAFLMVMAAASSLMFRGHPSLWSDALLVLLTGVLCTFIASDAYSDWRARISGNWQSRRG